MKLLFIRTPRYMWPVFSEEDNFLPPLGMMSLAAYLRENGFKDVNILDCALKRMGWRSLKNFLLKEKPDIIGIGSETMYAHEDYKLVRLVKSILPNTTIIGGGFDFSYRVDYVFKNVPVDFIICGEGEETLLELIKELNKQNKTFHKIKGIVFKDDKGKIIITPRREPIKDLDKLPYPAWDLVKLEEYKISPCFGRTVVIEHGRGCINNCRFCCIWKHYSNYQNNNSIELKPIYRTKSAKRCVDEIEILIKKYNRNSLMWADATWNADSEWSKEFIKEMKKRKLKIQQFAFVRADCVIRDENMGILKGLIETGFDHALMGVEKITAEGLEDTRKRIKINQNLEAIKILNKRDVYTNCTFLIGPNKETKKSIVGIADFAIKNKLNWINLHPIAPLPGTDFTIQAEKEGLVRGHDYRRYDWMTNSVKIGNLTHKQIENCIGLAMVKFVLLSGILFRCFYGRKKMVDRTLVKAFFKLIGIKIRGIFDKKFKSLYKRALNADSVGVLIKPKWYEN